MSRTCERCGAPSERRRCRSCEQEDRWEFDLADAAIYGDDPDDDQEVTGGE